MALRKRRTPLVPVVLHAVVQHFTVERVVGGEEDSNAALRMSLWAWSRSCAVMGERVCSCRPDGALWQPTS